MLSAPLSIPALEGVGIPLVNSVKSSTQIHQRVCCSSKDPWNSPLNFLALVLIYLWTQPHFLIAFTLLFASDYCIPQGFVLLLISSVILWEHDPTIYTFPRKLEREHLASTEGKKDKRSAIRLYVSNLNVNCPNFSICSLAA